MRRNNEERLMGVHKPTPSEEVPQMPNPMDFVTPTQFIPLPSKGKYPKDHPLHGQDSIEIKYMTAKDEDILTNRSLLRKGLAIDRLIQNIIKDPSIDAKSLYVGDRNSIIIHARASAYGSDYRTSITCPACEKISKFKFNLNDFEIYHGDDFSPEEITDNLDGTFTITLPISGIVARIRPLLGHDETQIVLESNDEEEIEDLITRQMKRFVVEFNGYSDKQIIDYVCDNMTASESKLLRGCFKLISADINLEQTFTCKNCGHEEVMSVPFGTEFFWPE